MIDWFTFFRNSNLIRKTKLFISFDWFFFCFVFHITDIIIIYNMIIIFFYSKILFFGLRSTDQIKLFGTKSTKQNKIKSIKLLFLFSFIFSFPFSLDLFAMIFLRPRINPLIILVIIYTVSEMRKTIRQQQRT